ncbi:hypothetical protein [Phormidesmis sp. 146-33]
MHTLPPCKFAIGQRVRTTDNSSDEGVILAILYAETITGHWWSRPGFSYWIAFNNPRPFEDSAHETELEELS